jgi:hypothetical protein
VLKPGESFIYKLDSPADFIGGSAFKAQERMGNGAVLCA